MSFIYKNKSGYWYYREKNKHYFQNFSLKTKYERVAKKLKKEWDQRFLIEIASGETNIQLIRKSIPLTIAVKQYLEY